MSLPTADWYFDVISPFAYLQWQQRGRLAGLVTLRPVPVVLGALLGHWEQKGPAEIPPKRLQTYRRCQWHAEHLGIQFRFPPAHPFNPIAALRLAVACGASEAAVDAVFGAAFGEGRDVSDMAVLEEIGRKLGIEDVAATIARPEVKAQLRANTDAAIARGVFGVPTVDAGGELFWGEDATGMLLDYLKNPALFASPEMQRLQHLPMGAQRDTAKKPA
ncbi:MAG TPA: 2-hydroxychromene-2-carboxylate isomerase [Acidocella sp.]|jgi:2-hydroxychromene-2-carboxylate isomerase|nr:2-hydroxychromene-2-carboxylate isomerase [Acidocella sp.]